MANSKTIIDKKQCPASISKALYKYDQIIPYFKRHLNDKKNDMDVAENRMYQIANYLVEHHTPIEYDNHSKYRLTDDDFINNNEIKYDKPKNQIK